MVAWFDTSWRMMMDDVNTIKEERKSNLIQSILQEKQEQQNHQRSRHLKRILTSSYDNCLYQVEEEIT